MSAMDSTARLATDHVTDNAGDQLRAAREQLNLSLREIASDLNLMVSHVRGMETNRCAHLTDDKNFLGHMRSYATRVDIDPNDLVELYRSQSAAETSKQTLPTKRFNALSRYDSKWYAVGVLALACVSLGVWSLQQAAPTKAKNSTAEKNAATTPVPADGDRIEVPAVKNAVKPAANAAASVVDAMSETPATTSAVKAKSTRQADAPVAAQALVRSDHTAPATGRKLARKNAANDVPKKAQYKNALRSLGAKPLRETLIELRAAGATPSKG